MPHAFATLAATSLSLLLGQVGSRCATVLQHIPLATDGKLILALLPLLGLSLLVGRYLAAHPELG